MVQKYIATALHKMVEVAPDEPILARSMAAHHFVIDRKLVDLLGRSDVVASIRAALDADLFHLPYPEVAVEFEAEDGVRRLVLLTDKDGGFDAYVCAYSEPVLTVSDTPLMVMPDDGKLHISGKGSSDLDRLAAGFAAAVALLILNIRGVDREVVEPTALNRKRVDRGLPPVPHHAVFHIGTIYDRDGRPVSGSRRAMPVHLRSGYIRQQVHGKGRVERKLVYIAPVLVNYQAGGPDPAPTRKIVTA